MFAMPTYSDSVANLELDGTRSFRFNASRDLMTGHNGVFKPWVGTFHGQAIAVADTAMRDFHLDIGRRKGRRAVTGGSSPRPHYRRCRAELAFAPYCLRVAFQMTE